MLTDDSQTSDDARLFLNLRDIYKVTNVVHGNWFR